MSIYSERLARLKREIVALKQQQKKRAFKPNQIIMINFINGLTKKAIFNINVISSLQYHILVTHYCGGCPGELDARDIINIDMIISKGFRLNEVGVTNKDLVVYQYMKGQAQYKLVLKPMANNSLVVTMYSVG
ncbi:MAG: hypothetical protein M1300_11815 [Epsilonproteobacteria bacterium]|nr:hypothetical protein [Campylobacterota bacterium]